MTTGYVAERYVRETTDACKTLQLLPHGGSVLPGAPAGLRKIGVRHRVTITFTVSDQEQLVTILGVYYAGRSIKSSPA